MDALEAMRLDSARFGCGIRIGRRGDGGAVAFAPPEQSVLVIGPPRSGKTSSLIVPNVLSAGGPVVATSTKPDVIGATAPARSRAGDCVLFDPTGRATGPPGVRRVAWSPIASALDWDAALRTTEAMVMAARPGSARGEAQHWTERAQALLAPSFHAAALDEMPMSELLSLLDRRQGGQLRAILARQDVELPLHTLEGVLATEEREQSGIWSTACSVLTAYRSSGALESTTGEAFDARRFVAASGTLYVCAGSQHQRHAAPIVTGLLNETREAAYEACARGTLGYRAGRPPLLMALDELANIAPIHDLPAQVSEGGSQGVVTLGCLQDLSQARERWGQYGEGFLTLFNVKVVLPGVGDTRTLEALSLLAGDHEVKAVSVSDGERLRGLAGLLGVRAASRSTTSTRRERRLPVSEIARGREGHAVCFEGAEPSFVRMLPWYRDPLSLQAASDSRPAPSERRLSAGLGGHDRTGRGRER